LKKNIVKYQPGEIIKQADNYLGHLNYLTPEKNEPFLIPYRKGNKWGFCTEDKKIVIDCVYDNVKPFSEGLACVSLKGRGYFFINSSNQVLIPEIQDGIPSSFDGGVSKIAKISHQGVISYSYIDKRGKNLVPFVYVLQEFSEGLAAIKINNKFGFISKQGDIVIPCKFEVNYEHRMHSIGKFSEGLCRVKQSDKWFYLNKNGEVEIVCDFDCVYDFSNGVAAVFNNGKWGFIDKQGNVVIPFQYDSVDGLFSEGLTSVRIGEYFGFINISGKTVIPFKYRLVGEFSEGLTYVQNDDYLYGFINMAGETTIPFKFEHLSSFSGGLAFYRNHSKCGFINIYGEKIISFNYDYVKNLHNGILKVGFETPGQPNEWYINLKGVEYRED